MTPQLVDHAHIDSCIVIGCNLVQPRRKMNMFISGRSHIAVASQSLKEMMSFEVELGLKVITLFFHVLSHVDELNGFSILIKRIVDSRSRNCEQCFNGT